MKIVIIPVLKQDPLITFFVRNGIKIGELIMHIVEAFGYSPMNMKIDIDNVIDIPLNKKVIKYTHNGCLKVIIKLKKEQNICHYITKLKNKIVSKYCHALFNFNNNRQEYAELLCKEYILYNEYLREIKKQLALVDKKNVINLEDPISLDTIDKVRAIDRFYWMQNGKTYWMDRKNIKNYLAHFTKQNPHGFTEIIHPFHDAFIAEPWRTEMMELAK